MSEQNGSSQQKTTSPTNPQAAAERLRAMLEARRMAGRR